MWNPKIIVTLIGILAADIASAQVATRIDQLSTLTPPPIGGTVVITDPGKESILYRIADNVTIPPCSTILAGPGAVRYQRLVMGGVNAGWWMSETAEDNASAFDCALSIATPSQEVYLANGTYRFSRAVAIPITKEININIGATLLFPVSSGMIVRGGNHKIYVRTIRRNLDDSYGDNAGAGLVLEDAFSNNIYVGSIEGFGEGIKLTATGTDSANKQHGTQYNRITFDRLFYNNTGISLTTGPHLSGYPSGPDPWVNENTFVGGSIHAQTGIRTIYDQSTSQQTDRYNNNKFYNIGFEKTVHAINLSYTRGTVFIGSRFERAPNNLPPEIYISDDSTGNVFFGGEIYKDSIKKAGNDTSLFGWTLFDGGTFKGPVVGSGTGTPLEVLVKKPVNPQ